MNKNIEGGPIFILGEMHGADVNPQIIKEFVLNINPKAVFFEWPIAWQDALENNDFQSIQNYASQTQDGRFLEKHFELLVFLKEQGIKVFGFDSFGKSFVDREQKMAKNIKIILKNNNLRKEKIIVVTGNLHARKKVFKLEGELVSPLALRLGKGITSIFIRYGSGKIYNFKTMKVSDKYVKSKIVKHGKNLITSKSLFYDYEYLVDNTKAGKIPSLKNKRPGNSKCK